MLLGVSETARYGGLTVGPYVINEDVKKRMKEAARGLGAASLLRSGLRSIRGGAPRLRELLEQVSNSQVERVGEFLRQLMRSK